MAQYLAFLLAGDAYYLTDRSLASPDLNKSMKTKTPITAITFASPKIGTSAFRQAFTQLEREGWVRHIRVSNAGDAIPMAQTLPGNFTQTGLNLYVSDNEVSVNYDTTKYEEFSDAVEYGMRTMFLGWWFLGFLKFHELPDYSEKLFKNAANNHILDKTVEELYQKYTTCSVQ